MSKRQNYLDVNSLSETVQSVQLISHNRLTQELRYEPDTGDFFWLIAGRGRRMGRRVGCKTVLGNNPGHKRGGPYWTIGVNGRLYYAHRLAWLYMTGEWSIHQIDHADCDGLNNRWDNLREATPGQNKGNGRLYKNNTSGFKGVGLHGGRWRARISFNRKQVFLGDHDSPEVAHEAYCEAAQKYYGAFANSGGPPDINVPLTDENLIEAANAESGGLRLSDYIKRVRGSA